MPARTGGLERDRSLHVRRQRDSHRVHIRDQRIDIRVRLRAVQRGEFAGLVGIAAPDPYEVDIRVCRQRRSVREMRPGSGAE
jgi:hypothetical protein